MSDPAIEFNLSNCEVLDFWIAEEDLAVENFDRAYATVSCSWAKELIELLSIFNYNKFKQSNYSRKNYV